MWQIQQNPSFRNIRKEFVILNFAGTKKVFCEYSITQSTWNLQHLVPGRISAIESILHNVSLYMLTHTLIAKWPYWLFSGFNFVNSTVLNFFFKTLERFNITSDC